jgi:hypothetical protein
LDDVNGDGGDVVDFGVTDGNGFAAAVALVLGMDGNGVED